MKKSDLKNQPNFSEETTSSFPSQNTSESPQISSKKTGFLIVLLLAIFVGATFLSRKERAGFFKLPAPNAPFLSNSQNQPLKIKKFASEAEFKEFIQNSRQNQQFGYAMNFNESVTQDSVMPQRLNPVGAPMMEDSKSGRASETLNRVSETNVQVKGIDEPDIIKTDGNTIFYSYEGSYYPIGRPMPVDIMENMPSKPFILPSGAPRSQNQIKTISAFPPTNLKELGKIEKQGNLLLDEDTLMVFTYNGVYAYDISQPEKPEEKWTLDLEKNGDNSIVTSRLKDGKLYLITRSYINDTIECPIRPFRLNGEDFTVQCTDISYPANDVDNIDTNYTVLVLDAQTGEMESSTNFVGSTSTSATYMSAESLYLTYQMSGDMLQLFNNFLADKGKDFVPAEIAQKLKDLQSLNISKQAKLFEMQQILSRYQRSLNKDDRMKFDNEMRNKMESYLTDHARQLEKTGVVRIDTDNLKVQATGELPGHLLNQFSLDEYNDNLRAAVTFGGNWSQFGRGKSASDVYVLDRNLAVKGSVRDLGLDERIYSVRFVNDQAYVVTFRQTDPFYVLDLKDPNNPRKTGELKIPGFSSYLHPLTKNLILGVGQENGQVKLSLFDVSDPSNPQEVSKYMLDEYYTEVSNNHHAFLQDEKHDVFFMPGGKGGYIFSYENSEIKLTKTVSDVRVKRAIFINNYMYVVGDDRIVVLNENNWETVNQMKFE